MEDKNQVRINKYLSEVGYCSRRAADKLIDAGRVTINGKVPEMGTKISSGDEVRVDGALIAAPKETHVYIAFNKPVGIVCTTDTEGEKDNIIDYINHPKRIFHIGRLDKPSEGLILLTSDGDIVNKILRSKNNHEKEYQVKVRQPITADFIRQMREGVPILDTVTKKCKVVQTGKFTFRIILTQGLNRQIRRMCDFLGYEVVALKRTRIMHIQLDVPVGKWRDLSPKELDELNALVADSSKTFD
ncbi:MAG: 23S rRNA pseudouridine(2604) synthase RluF [Cyclobacterium sp.]|uniref:23S rRNA pseudouridine(2604) synthase RluF n=1 Tax=unclassified Cyclobacterium TaxID=2615055 RepID=UPI0013D78DC5|nr:23S rRNA pseudouridine(2604) synthase RluF [Cyclobacterium sp. SYSU L10401]